MRDHEHRAADQRVADRDTLRAAAETFRHRAADDAHAGIRGRDVADAFAEILDLVSIDPDRYDGHMRRAALRAARMIQTGPDGPNDPRTGRWSHLASGDGV